MYMVKFDPDMKFNAGDTLSSANALSAPHCTIMCLMTENCRGVHWNKDGKTCELISAISVCPVANIPAPGLTAYGANFHCVV